MQSAATGTECRRSSRINFGANAPNFAAAGGLGILAVSAIPAMYRMELLSPRPVDDVGKLIALTVAAGFFGVFFVIPLRKYYVVRQKLTFPTPAATGELHVACVFFQ